MPVQRSSNERASAAPATHRGRRLALAAALGLFAAAVAGCSGRDRARTVDADLGHDLDLASTTGIELANRTQPRTQVVSAIEEGPRSAVHRAARSSKSAGHRRAPVAKPKIEAPPATVMVADHEMTGAASTEAAAGPEPVSTAPAPEPSPGPMVVPEPVSYPSGGGAEPGRGSGVGAVLGGIIGAVLRGGSGGVDRCDERHTHGRRGGGVDVSGFPIPTGGANLPWPRGRTTFPRY